MTPEEKNLLLKDLCTRLPYGVQAEGLYEEYDDNDEIKQIKTCGFITCITRNIVTIGINDDCKLGTVKPYLRPMESMTEEEAKEIATLHGLKKILSVKITDEYIDVIMDDGVCSTERMTLWYDELVSSIECFDWLNKKMFDYRGLIQMGLALPATEGMYND